MSDADEVGSLKDGGDATLWPVELRDMRKSYGGVHALRGASCVFRAGEIVGLVGKNGAGKSTLIRILAGVTSPSDGRISVGEVEVHLRLPKDAMHHGIAVVHQELALVPTLSVAENIWLGLGYPRRAGLLVQWGALRTASLEVLQRLGVQMDVDAPVSSLSVAHQRFVMIARGVAAGARMLILDEPSASFTEHEVRSLHTTVRRLGAAGVCIVYVSHRVDEILSLTDRVLVMRDGVVVGESATAELSRDALVASISGPDAVATTLSRSGHTFAGGGEAIRADHLAGGKGNLVRDGSISVNNGEIVGIAGLAGAGRTELVRLLYGCERPSSGRIAIGGEDVILRSCRAAIQHGIALVPEDRKGQGVLLGYSVLNNLTLPSLDRFRRFKRIPIPNSRQEVSAALNVIEDFDIVTGDVHTPVGNLSGGNQQKVAVSKWLLHGADVFIFDEPSIGIDVHAKTAMLRKIQDLAASGKAIIVISSEFEELESVCDRVFVMREGVTVGQLVGDEVTQAKMLQLCYA